MHYFTGAPSGSILAGFPVLAGFYEGLRLIENEEIILLILRKYSCIKNSQITTRVAIRHLLSCIAEYKYPTKFINWKDHSDKALRVAGS